MVKHMAWLVLDVTFGICDGWETAEEPKGGENDLAVCGRQVTSKMVHVIWNSLSSSISIFSFVTKVPKNIDLLLPQLQCIM